jgi:hypothetical protein
VATAPEASRGDADVTDNFGFDTEDVVEDAP